MLLLIFILFILFYTVYVFFLPLINCYLVLESSFAQNIQFLNFILINAYVI